MAFVTATPRLPRRNAARATCGTRRTVAVAEPPAAPPTVEPVGGAEDVTVSLMSLGCPKNVTDAEVMLGDLAAQGLRVVTDGGVGDVVVVNTCGFVEDAKTESIAAILEATGLKGDGVKGVVVTGCLAQRYADALAEELPEVDAVVGFEHYAGLAARIRGIAESADLGLAVPASVAVGSPTVPFRPEHERIRLGAKHSAYVRTAEGCDMACSYCSIPSFRGKFRSKPWDTLTTEIEKVAASGAVELILIAEDTNQYGIDFELPETRRLSHLLHHISENVPSVKWVRLLYCYPSFFTEELIEAIAKLNCVCKYIDIPLQHISDKVLRKMNRPGRAHTESLLRRLEHGIPGLSLRTTFICGFPGETDEDHRELVEFVKEMRFANAGFFAYSEEEGTPAADFENQVPMDVRQLRRDELVSVQQGIQEELALENVGTTLQVLIDSIKDGHSVGRSRANAPEIDAHVHVLQKLKPGTLLDVNILGTSSFDLYGEPAE